MKIVRFISFALILLLPTLLVAQYHARDCIFIYPIQQWDCNPNWIVSSLQVGSWDDVKEVEDKEADYVMSFWKADSCAIDASSSDDDLGTVWGGGRYVKHTSVWLAAVPKADVRFVEWSDGVRDNPRQLALDSNQSLVAVFSRMASYTPSRQVASVEAEITVRGQRIYVKGASGYHIRIYDEWGHCVTDQQRTSSAETSYLMPKSGTYFVQIGATSPQKIVVE